MRRWGDDHGYADDQLKLSTCYKQLGGVHIVGPRACTPKRFRATLVQCCDPEEYTSLRLTDLSDEFTDFNDLALFVVSGVKPDVKPRDLHVTKKGEFRGLVKKEFLRLKRMQPERLKPLAGDFMNLPIVAMNLGYPRNLLSQEVWNTYSLSLSAVGNVFQPGTGPMQPGMLALEDDLRFV